MTRFLNILNDLKVKPTTYYVEEIYKLDIIKSNDPKDAILIYSHYC